MTEADLQKAVIDVAHLFGWLVAHFRTAQTPRGNYVTPVQGDGKGYPDLTLVKGERLIFAELKSDKGRLSPEQVKWQTALSWTPAEVYVWRPSDLEHIAKVLRAA